MSSCSCPSSCFDSAMGDYEQIYKCDCGYDCETPAGCVVWSWIEGCETGFVFVCVLLLVLRWDLNLGLD